MNFITERISLPQSLVRKICWLIVALLLVLSLTSTAQDCVDTYFLESETITAGETKIYSAASTIYGSAGKQFIVESQGRAIFKAGKRIELNTGFQVQAGGGLSATIGNCNEEPVPEDPFEVFPNPTEGIINIKAPHEITTIRLFDMTGLLVYEIQDVKDTAYSLDITKARPGFYILEITTAKVIEKVRIEKI